MKSLSITIGAAFVVACTLWLVTGGHPFDRQFGITTSEQSVLTNAEWFVATNDARYLATLRIAVKSGYGYSGGTILITPSSHAAVQYSGGTILITPSSHAAVQYGCVYSGGTLRITPSSYAIEVCDVAFAKELRLREMTNSLLGFSKEERLDK
jgi:hypothetical protein